MQRRGVGRWGVGRSVAMAMLWLAVGCAGATRGPGASFRPDRIRVTTSGTGPDVVLISGLASSAEQVWGGTVAAVPGYRYHLVQVAGFAGVSPGGNAGDGPVVEPVADEIARYIATRRLDRPAVVGLSMGGSLGMLIAARHPQAISKLLVVDMVPFMGLFFGPASATPDRLRPVAAGVRDAMSGSDSAYRRTMREGFAAMVRTDSLRGRVIADGVASDRSVAGRAMYDLILLDLRPEMPGVRVPVTVLYVHGPHVPLSAAATDSLYRAAFATTPRVTLTRVPDAYHFIMLDQPRRFADALRAFLR